MLRHAGACRVLGGLGEVGTSPAARRTGIATALTQQALDDFRDRGGQALFLGTVNPAAARIYHRLGWRKLAGARLMVNVLNGDSPEEFLVDYFRGSRRETLSVRAPSPADRAPMIPLLAAPHDWQVLDFNVGVMSTRYAVLDSCLGLYRRYAAIAGDGRGAWFCAGTDRGNVVGLSTARLDEEWRMPRRCVHAQVSRQCLANSDSGSGRLERGRKYRRYIRRRFSRGRRKTCPLRVRRIHER